MDVRLDIQQVDDPCWQPVRSSRMGTMKSSSSTFAKKARRIRKAGKKTEREFFGKGGPLEVKKNPITVVGLANPQERHNKLSFPGKPWFVIGKRAGKKKSGYIIWHEGSEESFTHHDYPTRGRVDWSSTFGPFSTQDEALSYIERIMKGGVVHGTDFSPSQFNPRDNPPRSISANIEGIIYNRCIEIRAEKTGYKKGFYKHPFSRGSQVCIYALDNGDLLVHSKAGMKLWQPD